MIEARNEVVPIVNRAPQWRHDVVIKGEHGFATETDEMMMPVETNQLVGTHAVPEVDFAHQTEIAKMLQDPVDSRAIRRLGIRRQSLADLFRGQVFPGGERRQNRHPLRRDALAKLPQTTCRAIIRTA